MNLTPRESANFVIEALIAQGYSAFLVGGCVRDTFLGVTPKDFDVATNAKPDAVISLFTKVIPTGIKHGTVTVMVGNEPIEVTTFRTEGTYSDSRHPDEVKFVADIKEDLARRDFTINAMAMNGLAIVDPFNGRDDLKNKVIRCVGNPDERFSEDPLRMMRAIRFACRLGFTIEELTLASIRRNCEKLVNISNERIRDEFTKTLVANSKRGFNMLRDSWLLPFVIPEIGEASPLVFSNGKGIESQMAALFIGFSHNTIIDAMRRMKFSVDEINLVVDMAEAYQNVSSTIAKNYSDRDVQLRRFVGKFSEKGDLPEVLDFLSSIGLGGIEDNVERVMKSNPCVTIKGLAVNGNDLSGLGFKGRCIGETLRSMLEIVFVNPEMNSKKSLIPICESLLKS